MKIMSPFKSFIWTMTFYLRKFKVLDLVYTNKLLDCDSMKVYWNIVYFIKTNTYLQYYKFTNVGGQF